MSEKKLKQVARRLFNENGRFAIECPGCGKELEVVIDDLAFLHDIRSRLVSGELKTVEDIARFIKANFDKNNF